MMILPKNWTVEKWLKMQGKLINFERPVAGEVFQDIEDRILYIDKVDLGNELGREIQGQIDKKDSMSINDYSCTLDIWATTWRDKCPRQDPSKMVC